MSRLIFILGGLMAMEGAVRWETQGFSSAALSLVLAVAFMAGSRGIKF